MTAPPQLRTPRLLLRGWTDDDRKPFAEMNADPAVMEFFPAVMTAEESNAFVDRIQIGFAEHGFGLWALEELGSGSFLGFTGLSVPTFEAPFLPAVEIGWRLRRSGWGHGYATEAARAALEFGFGDLGLAEVVSFTARVNRRSTAVMERLGMRPDPDADFLHPRVPAGLAIAPHVLYRVKSGEFRTHPFER
jgi:RimJ/RimL family protein N-acetyltransferase